jgi:hypothetical protein
MSLSVTAVTYFKLVTTINYHHATMGSLILRLLWRNICTNILLINNTLRRLLYVCNTIPK